MSVETMPSSYEDALYSRLGSRLRQARNAAGHTQAELGRFVGLTRTSITNIERGIQRPPLHVIYQLAAAVGVPPTRLMPEPSSLPTPPGVLEGLDDSVAQWVRNMLEESRTQDEEDSD